MRWLLPAVLLASLLSGCMVQDDPPTQSTDDGAEGAADAANATATRTSTQAATATRAPAAASNATGNGTAAAEGNATGNATGNSTANATAAAPSVLVYEDSFSGSLPLDGATTAAHAFTVPAGGTRLVVVYTSDHVGMFSAVAEVFDPSGASKLYSLDACAVGFDPPAATSTCEMVLEEALAPGAWSGEIYYQAGQVIEDYTLDVQVWGVPA